MRVILPYPPSANERLTIRKDGGGFGSRRFINTPRYRAWMKEAQWIVAMAVRDGRGIGYGKIAGTYRLDAVAHPPSLKRTRDVENLLKATCDALTKGGAIEDDSLCQEISLRWGELDGPGILVEVRSCQSQLSPVDGKSKPPSGTVKSPTRRQRRLVATIQDAVIGELSATGRGVLRVSAKRPSFTSADGTVCEKTKTKPKT